MGNMAIGPKTPVATTLPEAQRQIADLKKELEKANSPSGWDVRVASTFSAGRFDGEKTVLFGARAELGREVVTTKLARVSVVGDLHGGIGNGLNAGFGLGARGELGSRKLNVYGTLMPQINMGIGMNGMTAGAGIRAAGGLQVGKFYAEVAKDAGSNMNMTSAAVGMRINF
jgi:hypothetical protein